MLRRIALQKKRLAQLSVLVALAVAIIGLSPILAAAATTVKHDDEATNPWWKKTAFVRRLGRIQQRIIGKLLNQRNGKSKQQPSQPQNDEPSPLVVEDFLTADEAETLLERYGPLLRESLHAGKALGGRQQSQSSQSRYRTSRSVRLPPLGDSLVFDLERRAAQLAGRSSASSNNNYSYPHGQVEDFQFACYDTDQLYGLHRDDDEQGRANRSATVLIYIQEPDQGGSTLFTRRPLEEEKDLDTNRPLRTEAGALKLFRHYCSSSQNEKKRRKKRQQQNQFVVVEPKQGRAVAWPNWYSNNGNNTGHQIFAKASTHGACPVRKGTKCAIQQWISRDPKPHPLRDERVVAIFPAGADYSYRFTTTTTTSQYPSAAAAASITSKNCLTDVSVQLGQFIPTICAVTPTTTTPADPTTSSSVGSDNNVFEILPSGPYSNVGSLKPKRPPDKATLVTSLPSQLFLPGNNNNNNNNGATSGGGGGAAWTVSFWARNLSPGTMLLSVGGGGGVENNNNSFFAINVIPASYPGRIAFELVSLDDEGSSSQSSRLHVKNDPFDYFVWQMDWHWYSLQTTTTTTANTEEKEGDPSSNNACGNTSITMSWQLQVFEKDGMLLGTTSLTDLIMPPSLLAMMMMNADTTNHDGVVPLRFLGRQHHVPTTTTISTTTSTEEGTGAKTAFVHKSSQQQRNLGNSNDDAELSFIVFHKGILDESEVRAFRRQIMRYDVNQ